jgi:hypothetical protein
VSEQVVLGFGSRAGHACGKQRVQGRRGSVASLGTTLQCSHAGMQRAQRLIRGAVQCVMTCRARRRVRRALAL